MNITEILTQAQQSSDAVTDLLIELAQQNKEVSATAQHMPCSRPIRISSPSCTPSIPPC